VPLHCWLACVLKRPATHFRRDGTLSAEGLRQPEPCRQKPDVDNAAKLILDALEGYAYPRDVAITEISIVKRWADSDAEPACTYVTVEVGQ
jgi:Holliday junction resolvase RusA-like endonuclease